MLEYASNKFGRWRKVDIDGLWLADGRNANELNQWQLFAELKRLGVPHIKENMAKVDLLFLLGCHEQEVRESARQIQ
jgi:hypothetical protein